jgi:cytoskeleton protein RodZ
MNQDESRHISSGQGTHHDNATASTPKGGLSQTDLTLDMATEGNRGEPGASFGDELRAARERRGQALESCARELHLPSRLLRKLEADDYTGIDYSVYLRGYLEKYAACVGLDEDRIQAQLEHLRPKTPQLVAPRQVSLWQRLIHRYSSAATYVVLTAIIMVPLVWFGLSGGLKHDVAKLAPLDAVPVGAHSTALTASNADGHASQPAENQDPSPAKNEKPLMASIAPFSAMESPADTPSKPVQPESSVATSAQAGQQISLTLQQQSWVQIIDSTGKRLEYALLPAGTHKTYASNRALDVRIGNADGADVRVNGKPIALEAFQHANVAHFNLSTSGKAKPPTD